MDFRGYHIINEKPNYHGLNIINLMHEYALHRFVSTVLLFNKFTVEIAYLSPVDVGPGQEYPAKAATLNNIF